MENYIYHNPRCSKSCEALRLVEANGRHCEVREYLQEPLSEEQLSELCRGLNIRPYELVRMKDLDEGREYPELEDDEGWIQLLSKNPAFMQRPIVCIDGRLIIARPPERVNRIV